MKNFIVPCALFATLSSIYATDFTAANNAEADRIFNTFLQEHRSVAVFFMLADCPPCQLLKTSFQPLTEKYSDQGLSYLMIDYAQFEQWAEKRFGISCVPTFMFFKDGQEIAPRILYSEDPIAVIANTIEEHITKIL